MATTFILCSIATLGELLLLLKYRYIENEWDSKYS